MTENRGGAAWFLPSTLAMRIFQKGVGKGRMGSLWTFGIDE
jgi:hypothetical protein